MQRASSAAAPADFRATSIHGGCYRDPQGLRDCVRKTNAGWAIKHIPFTSCAVTYETHFEFAQSVRLIKCMRVPSIAPDMKAISRQKNGFKNRILKRVPPSRLRRLRKHLKEVTLARRDALHEPNTSFRYVYFPETAMVSVLTVLNDGTETEVASIGSEGIVGLPVFLGAKKCLRKASCQMPGTAFRLPASVLLRETRRGGPLATALHSYALALFAQLAQLATCNRRHTIEQRCCCWLLMTHDRVEGNEFYVTHEFLSQMISARRSGVTVIAGTLQRAGLISYRRGHIRILDRKGLEKAACECYGIVRNEVDRLLG